MKSRRLAVDVVILPPADVSAEAIRLNRSLRHKSGDQIALHPRRCLPHISLAMGVLEPRDGKIVRKLLKEIAQKTRRFNILLERIRVEGRKKKTALLPVKRSRELQVLHEEIVGSLSDYFRGEAEKEMFAESRNVSDSNLRYVEKYSKESSFDRFRPHLTIGYGEGEILSKELSFTASGIALCQLGPHCTCRKILARFHFKRPSRA